MEFYNDDATHYDKRHENATTRHIRRAECRLIEKYGHGNILDIGCGTGFHLSFIEKMNKSAVKKIVGVDSSKEMLEIASKNRAEVKCMSADAINFDDSCFDTVICFNTLNFLDKRSFSEISRVLKSNGFLIVSAASIYDNNEKKTKNVRINNKRLRMNLYDKNEFINLFQKDFVLVEFHSLFHLQKPYWNWFREFTFTEKTKLFAEKFLAFRKERGRIYLAVFRKK